MAENPFEPLRGNLESEPPLGDVLVTESEKAPAIVSQRPQKAITLDYLESSPAARAAVERLPLSTTDNLRTMYRTMKEDPDTVSKAAGIAARTGLPIDVVRRRMDEAEHLDSEPNWDELYEKAPKLTGLLSSTPELFQAAKDDTETLGALERSVMALESTGAGVAMGTLGVSEMALRTPDSLLRYREFLNDVGGGTVDLGVLGQVLTAPSRALGALAEGFEIGGFSQAGTTQAAEGVARAQGILTDEFEPFRRIAAASQQADEALAAALQGDMSPLGDVLTNPDALGAFIGQALPTLYLAYKSGGSLPFMAWMEGQAQAGQVAQFEEETGTRVAAGDFVQATSQSALIGSILEKFGLSQVLGKEGANFFARILRGAVGEAGTEALQELNSNLAAIATYDPDQNPIQGLLPAAVGGAGAGGTMAAFPLEQRRARDAGVFQNRITELTELANQSKLRERSPEQFQKVMDRMTQGAGEDLYVDATEFTEYFQEVGIDPMEIAAQLTGVAAQLPDALQRGGDLRIKTSEFVTRLGATEHAAPLSALVRPEPQAMSAREAAEWQANQQQRFQELVDQVDQDRAQDQEWQASVQQVEDFVTQQIVQSGRFSEEVARKDAALHGSMAKVLASRLGIQPHQVYERFGLRVQGVQETAGPAEMQQPDFTPQVAQLREAQAARAQYEEALDATMVEDQVFVEETGQTLTVQRPAREALEEARGRRDNLQRFVECLNG